jgi:hypothetical protein
MSYLIEPAGILLCSDALGDLVTEREFLPLVFDSYRDYRASLDTLSTLSPAVVGLGHHGTLNGALAKSAAHDARDCLDRYTAELWEEEATAAAASRFADSLTQRHWGGSRRFITRDLHNKSMLRMYELIIDAKENGNG